MTFSIDRTVSRDLTRARWVTPKRWRRTRCPPRRWSRWRRVSEIYQWSLVWTQECLKWVVERFYDICTSVNAWHGEYSFIIGCKCQRHAADLVTLCDSFSSVANTSRFVRRSQRKVFQSGMKSVMKLFHLQLLVCIIINKSISMSVNYGRRKTVWK